MIEELRAAFRIGEPLTVDGTEIPAAVIAELLLHGPDAETGRVRALHLVGARVTGELNLAAAAIDCEIALERCEFEHTIVLQHATTQAVYLRGCAIPELDAEALQCPGLDMRDAAVSGNVWLQGARINGDLNLDRVTIGGFLSGNLLTVDWWFNGRDGLAVTGSTSLRGARLGGVDIRGARTSELTAELIRADTLWAAGIETTNIELRGARIAGELDMDDATVNGTIRLDEADVKRLVLRPKAAGAISLRNAQVGTLVDRPEEQRELQLDGLTYERLEPLPHSSTRTRLTWLGPAYLPQPYEQLANAYRRAGLEREAREVLRAKEALRHQTLGPLGKSWGWLQNHTVGFGYRPGRALAWLAALLAVGTAYFSLTKLPPTGTARQDWDPFLYSLDRILPMDIGYERNWLAKGWFGAKGVAVLLTACGWLLVSTVAAAIARTLKRG